MTLADLTKEIPENLDRQQIADFLVEESDRGAAIMASAFVENTLEAMIRCSLPDWGQVTLNSWFEGPNAPFGSFSAKIALGQALAIYGPITSDILHRIRTVRNMFAHRFTPIDFKHPRLVAECQKLAKNEFLPGAEAPARTRFCSVCLYLGEQFVRDSFENAGKEITTRFG